jgi:hypothetical protein
MRQADWSACSAVEYELADRDCEWRISAMSDCLPHLLDDDEVAHLLGYPNTTAFRRRRKKLEAEGFPERRPVVKRYSPTEIREWIDGKNGLQSGSDPLLEVAGKWGA